MNLYRISEEAVSTLVELHLKSLHPDGRFEIIGDEPIPGQVYPLKVVFSLKNNQVFIVTAYPLKKRISK